MTRRQLYWIAKGLEGLGLAVVLAGVMISVSLGFEDAGLASMSTEFQALGIGGALFAAGFLIERKIGSR
jgi:hypothetical protein